MKKILTATILMMALTAIGCATAQPPAEPGPDPALLALEKSAKEVEAAMRQLVLLQTGSRQGGLRAVVPKDGPLGKKIVMNWNGPIEPAVKQVTKAIRYKYETLGTAPAEPIIVKVNATKESAYNLLDNIAWQSASKAQLLVDPLKKKITLAYLPTFGGMPETASIPAAHEGKN